jgi:hypothetical protein
MDSTNGSLPDDHMPASLGPSEGGATSPDATEGQDLPNAGSLVGR